MVNDQDEKEMERLITTYGDGLYRLCLLYLRDAHLAEDAVQDILLRAYRGRARFEGRASEKTWLTAIAANVCKNYLRGNWFRRVDAGAVLENIPAPPDAEPSDDALTREVLALPDKYRAPVLLYYYEGLSTRETAAALGLNENTVSTRLRRARGLLKTRLKGWMDDERPQLQSCP